LKFKTDHRIIIAALFLALYAFVATPVSYWHQHEGDKDVKQTEQCSKTEKKYSIAVGDDCKICSHHYSVADNDAELFVFLFINYFPSLDYTYPVSSISNPGYGESNKGPPATA